MSEYTPGLPPTIQHLSSAVGAGRRGSGHSAGAPVGWAFSFSNSYIPSHHKEKTRDLHHFFADGWEWITGNLELLSNIVCGGIIVKPSITNENNEYRNLFLLLLA